MPNNNQAWCCGVYLTNRKYQLCQIGSGEVNLIKVSEYSRKYFLTKRQIYRKIQKKEIRFQRGRGADWYVEDIPPIN